MIGVSAQFSVYPLGQDDLVPAIQAAVDVLTAHGLPFQMGSMSTVTWGDDQALFAALHEAFVAAGRFGMVVMTMTLSNACPRPNRGSESPAHGS